MVRLTQLWIQHQFFDNKLDVKAGYFGEGEDFNTFPCDFQNLAFCGSQVGNWATNIWYNWPVSQAAIRVKYNINDELYAQIGAYNQNPSQLEHGNGFKLSGSGTKGTVLPVELVWSPKVNSLPGEYRVGYYKSTAKADDVREDVNGRRRYHRRAYGPQQQARLLVRGAAATHQPQRRCFPRSEHRRQRHLPRQGHQLHRQLPVGDVCVQRPVRRASEG
jgi:carbohydrate-selective porin OprB